MLNFRSDTRVSGEWRVEDYILHPSAFILPMRFPPCNLY